MVCIAGILAGLASGFADEHVPLTILAAIGLVRLVYLNDTGRPAVWAVLCAILVVASYVDIKQTILYPDPIGVVQVVAGLAAAIPVVWADRFTTMSPLKVKQKLE